MKPNQSKRSYKKLSDQEKRTHTISSRVNVAELARLDEYRSQVKMRRGEYLRTAALSKIPPVVPKINQDKWVELGRLGANLNQISKKLNEGDDLLRQIEELKLIVVKTRIELLKVNDES